MRREFSLDDPGKILDHILTGGLVIYKNDFVISFFQLPCQLYMRRVSIENSSVIKDIYYFLLDNFLKVSKIDHHTVFYVVLIGNRLSYHRHSQFIAMTMYISALPVIPVQGMPGLKRKLLGDSHSSHLQINFCKDRSFSRA